MQSLLACSFLKSAFPLKTAQSYNWLLDKESDEMLHLQKGQRCDILVGYLAWLF